MKLKLNLFIFLLLFCMSPPCLAMDILSIKGSRESSTPLDILQSLCEFYGLEVAYLEVGEDDIEEQISTALKTEEPKAIVISWKAITKIAEPELFFQLVRDRGNHIPIMVMGLSPDTDSEILRKISSGRIKDLRTCSSDGFSGLYRFADFKMITRELAGQALRFEFDKVACFEINENSSVQSIIQIETTGNKTPYSIFVNAPVDGLEIFFLSQTQNFEFPGPRLDWRYKNQGFLELLAVAMFLRYACGDYCWHSPGHYANLAIDDPWLIEPYGYVTYLGLIKEMERANFHTTISVIPWNYDRSKQEVVSTFLSHPDRFSVCIHGNNHDHYEFYKYETNNADGSSAKTLEEQEFNIQQAIARMEEFKRLTGIPYDAVMVFPHGIAPEKTLELLKKYNFLATLNIDNVPLGSETPSDLLFRLRPFTTRFGNFLSFIRYYPFTWTDTVIAIDLFLGNPLLFSGHPNLFEKGIDAFNKTAEFVNRIQPDIEWVSMGYIARHTYLMRKRNDGNYEIQSFSKCVEVKNKQNHSISYNFRKKESFFPAIKKVTVNGKTHSYERAGDDLVFTLSLPPGETCLINIEYENDLDLASIDISKNDARVNRLRKFADFRDLTLTKYSWGRTIIKGYYGRGVFKYKIKRLAIYSLLFVAIIVSSILALRSRFNKHHD